MYVRSSTFYQTLLNFAVTPALATIVIGCVSAQTKQALNRSYEKAGMRLDSVFHLSPEDSNVSEDNFAGPIERSMVVRQAVARSPTLAAITHRSRALVYAGRAEGSLPSAEIGFETWNVPLARPYALGEAEMYMLELRQRFPAAGSLDARARAMSEEAQALLAELSFEERLVAERAAVAFTEYERAVSEKRIQEQQMTLLTRMGQAVRARYTTSGSAFVEVTRIDVEISKVQRALARVAGDITRARSMLNAVLRRPPDAPLGEPVPVPFETIRLTLEDLFLHAEKYGSTTLSANARANAASARREAIQAEALIPEFMVGVGYWKNPDMRPGIGVTASMSLPLLWGPNRNHVRQAEEEEAAEHATRSGVKLDTQAEISETHSTLLALEAQLRVIHVQALPATRRSLEALTSAFSTGHASLLEWVDVARSLLDLEMESIVLRSDVARNIAGLERIVGTPLRRTRLNEESAP